MSWLGIWLGLSVPTVEVANQVVFTVLFPITFISNVFVPLETLPTWLQPIAEWNPTSTLTGSLRELWGNPNPSVDRQHPSPVPDPRDARLGRRDHRGLRAARGSPLPQHEPLTSMLAPPWLLALALVLGLLVLIPARRLQLAGVAPRTIGLLALVLWSLAMLVAISPGATRVLVPILLARVPRAVRRGARTGSGGSSRRAAAPGADRSARPPMKNVTPPDADGPADAARATRPP